MVGHHQLVGAEEELDVEEEEPAEHRPVHLAHHGQIERVRIGGVKVGDVVGEAEAIFVAHHRGRLDEELDQQFGDAVEGRRVVGGEVGEGDEEGGLDEDEAEDEEAEKRTEAAVEGRKEHRGEDGVQGQGGDDEAADDGPVDAVDVGEPVEQGHGEVLADKVELEFDEGGEEEAVADVPFELLQFVEEDQRLDGDEGNEEGEDVAADVDHQQVVREEEVVGDQAEGEEVGGGVLPEVLIIRTVGGQQLDQQSAVEVEHDAVWKRKW